MCVCNFFFISRFNLKICFSLFSKIIKKTHRFFIHFMPLLKPLAPLFPFPAKEHVVFIFYIDDTGSVVSFCFVLCCALLAESVERMNERSIRSFIHSLRFFIFSFATNGMLLLFILHFFFAQCYSSSFAQLCC